MGHLHVLSVHSLLRWVVLLFMLWATIQAIVAYRREQPWSARHKVAGIGLVASLDLQVMVGAYLYLFLSPLPHIALDAGVTSSRAVRFFVLEHPTMMILAMILVHVGYAKAKRAERDQLKHKAGAVYYSIASLCVLTSIPWPGYFVERALLTWF